MKDVILGVLIGVGVLIIIHGLIVASHYDNLTKQNDKIIELLLLEEKEENN